MSSSLHAGVKVWTVGEVGDPAMLPRLARTELAAWLGADHQALDDLRLIASELVANALQHAAAQWVRLSLAPEAGFWRLAVADPGRNGLVPRPRMPLDADESGRGLRLVHELTKGLWGTYLDRAGERIVWALVPR
ncbi:MULTISPECIES: ATP-binding protein [unclassified Nonomuraea]|uniref:ATP-binding protein n=1 Tax=unclassified Nonomuraea TaxID=2593643 RepID=UPI0033E4FC63